MDSDQPSTDGERLPAVASRGELVVIEKEPANDALIDVVLGLVTVATEAIWTSLGRPTPPQSTALDAALELSWQGWSITTRAAAMVGRVGSPAVRVLLDPPLVPAGLRPATAARNSAAAWRERRPAAVAAVTKVRDRAVPLVVDSVVEPVDLTEIVLTSVDLDRIVDAVLDRIDLDAIAHERMDLLGLADYIVDGIDLPEIIRESTGSVASEAVRNVRMQSIDADEAVQRIVDRILMWRKGRSVEAPRSGATTEPSA